MSNFRICGKKCRFLGENAFRVFKLLWLSWNSKVKTILGIRSLIWLFKIILIEIKGTFQIKWNRKSMKKSKSSIWTWLDWNLKLKTFFGFHSLFWPFYIILMEIKGTFLMKWNRKSMKKSKISNFALIGLKFETYNFFWISQPNLAFSYH